MVENPMTSIDFIRAQVESNLAGALTWRQRRNEVCHRNCCLPQNVLTQICAVTCSVGRTTLLVSVTAQLLRQMECCAWIEAMDPFDSASAAAGVVDLSRFLSLWCERSRCLKSLEAFEAAYILVQHGGFRLITFDLASIDEQSLRQVWRTTWFRLACVMEKMPSTLVVLASFAIAKSCAGMTLFLDEFQDAWASRENISHGRLFSDVCSEVEIERHVGKTVRSERPRFQTGPISA